MCRFASLPGAPTARPVASQQPDFGDGGAYPDVHVIQYPLQMGAGVLGPGGVPPRLDVDYAQLQVSATALCVTPTVLQCY